MDFLIYLVARHAVTGADAEPFEPREQLQGTHCLFDASSSFVTSITQKRRNNTLVTHVVARS
jgi:hypothetical protein